MKVQTKLIILVSSLVIIFTITLTFFWVIERNRLGLVFKEETSDKNAIFDRIVQLKGRSLEVLVYDYTTWDELINFLVTGNKTWADETIDKSVLSNFRVNAIWIYKLDLSLTHSVNNLESSEFEEISLPKDAFNKLFARGRFCHFFLKTPQGLMEIRGATVHPTEDTERKTPPQGYFFAGRLWGKDYVADLSKLTDSRIEITLSLVEEPSVAKLRPEDGIIVFSRILTDWDKSPLMRVNVWNESVKIKVLNRTSKQHFFLLVIFTGVILFFLLIFLIRWISIPLVAISKTLKTENPTYINSLQKDKTEFGDISQLIYKFFEQRAELILEISERKLMQEELWKSEQKLKNAYNELKQTQAQLLQSEKIAMVGRLASGLAHEINNPLTGVLNNLQLIKMILEEKKDFNLKDFKDLMNVIEESALRCKIITQSLLNFSRTPKSQFQLISLTEAIEKVILLIEHEIKLENITIQAQLQPDLPHIMGDLVLLQQAILNIVSNAKWAIQRKSGQEGGLININTQHEPEKNMVYIYISDNGVGISKEDLNKIFEPFFTTKSVGEGTGLGLSIGYNIIKEHHGTIEVESEVNKGTTFKISIPAVVS